MKRLIAIAFTMLASTSLLGAQATNSVFENPMIILFILIGFIVLVTILVMVVAIYVIQVLNLLIRENEQAKAAKLGIAYKPQPGFFEKLWIKINDFKPVEKEEDILLDHDFDGIKELDNHLPPWWKWLFYGTIAWSVVYLIVYHVTDSLPLMEAEYQHEVSVAMESRAKLLAAQPAVEIDETSLAYDDDPALLQNGKEVFAANCVSCHSAQGQGGIGPNLTDDYWIHGGSALNIYSTIKNGVLEKGMIPWGPVLSQEEMRDVTYYIMSIHGTNPDNAKAPQGERYVEETVQPSDTTKTETQL